MKIDRTEIDAPPKWSCATEREDLGRGPVATARDHEGDVLEDERHADRGDQGGQPRCVPERSIDDPFDEDVEEPDDRHREHEGTDQEEREEGQVVDRPALAHDPAEEDHGHERADHEDVAMGEVDELDDPVDHRVAERDQRVDRADREGVDGLLDGVRQSLLRR